MTMEEKWEVKRLTGDVKEIRNQKKDIIQRQLNPTTLFP